MFAGNHICHRAINFLWGNNKKQCSKRLTISFHGSLAKKRIYLISIWYGHAQLSLAFMSNCIGSWNFVNTANPDMSTGLSTAKLK